MNKSELVENSNTSPKMLEKLANDEHWDVRYFVADNPNTQPEVLERLASDEHGSVRYNVAVSPNTPKYIKTYFLYQEYLNCYEF